MSNADPRPANRRDQQRADTRARIVAAATALFATRGFEGAALPAVAERCGDRVSLILYHFGSKDGLWRACVDAVFEQLNARTAELLLAHPDAGATTVEGLALLLRVYITAAADTPDYHRILFHEAMHDTPRLRWLVDTHQRRVSDVMVAFITQAQEAGLLPHGHDPMHLKFMLSGLLALPITLAPEYRQLTGQDPTGRPFIETHVAACLSLLGLDEGVGAKQAALQEEPGS
ncbi:TetR/AcrR family transcriptional regulator [Erythrobacteraceae bacterium CFH 75059]|uniref:TetR/AcrR family transcriptional regulator n=1 Tax=Qipengyuania thermophila TaxID=2509361 RepID=UPI00101E9F44|nr:TetR/AcrR family transcriptional regulator [Qipengyuania thermophila]TCD02073.1 TetR/AcrR family transcriptional regulator [Erythrobacteraceae bacterium CFH 75059]